MPRVHHVKRAAKNNSAVKKGESYYWWKFRYGGRHVSAKRPRPSQLTQSKYSEILAAQEDFEDGPYNEDPDGMQEMFDAANCIAETAANIADEYEEADEAMGGHQGQQYERAEGCRAYADEVESAIGEYDMFDTDEVGPNKTYADWAEALDALRDAVDSCSLDQL